MTGNKATKRIILQDRDLLLLIQIAVLRIIDREQARAITGTRSITRMNVRLRRLVLAGFLSRFLIGTIAGGRKAVYFLTRKGAAAAGVEFRKVPFQASQLGSWLFIEHQLGIGEVVIAVKYANIPGAELRRFLDFSSPLSPAMPLIPDGYFELNYNGQTRAMFFEVDLGSESQKVFARKVDLYYQLARSGEFARLFGPFPFRVLVLSTSERRLRNLRATAAKTTDKIFWFATLADIKREGLWARLWLRPNGDQKLSLL